MSKDKTAENEKRQARAKRKIAELEAQLLAQGASELDMAEYQQLLSEMRQNQEVLAINQAMLDYEAELRRTTMHNEETIRQRAYELWELNGMPEGKDLEFWLMAEAEAKEEKAVDASLEDTFPASDPPSSVMRS